MRKYTSEEWLNVFFGRVKAGSIRSCWLWTGATDGDGYAQVRIDGRTIHAHRALWIRLYGAAPPAVLHRCDNRKCVNPFHWIGGTQQQNIADCVGKNRHRSPQGEAHGSALLTDRRVKSIRRLRHRVRHKEIARRFGVSLYTVRTVIYGKSWRHVA